MQIKLENLFLLATALAVNLGKCFLRLRLGRDEVAQPPRAACPDQRGRARQPAQLRNAKAKLRRQRRNGQRRAALAEPISEDADDFLSDVSLRMQGSRNERIGIKGEI